ncbi:hypothetical protein [Sediminicoccus sp. KRV36]|uniref:hypothetical protein n=1 Tax=Sediminicoccus sp. KRV36 TaxID=3133721 RepID=UPI00200C503E|nr:hypothetical protein [Sediminicoccus rosea]UPY36611.1 hypothetical protein LHU95_20680 [Sediminicoccus rosea]
MRRRKPRVADGKLADALPSVTEAYMKFVADTEHDADPKAFAARHSAAKTALAHIEQLMKLAGPGEDEAGMDAAGFALGEARQEIQDEEQETSADDTGESG